MNLALINLPVFHLIFILILVTVHIGFFSYKYLAVDLTNYIFCSKEFCSKENRKIYFIFSIITILIFFALNQSVRVESILAKELLMIIIIVLTIWSVYVQNKIINYSPSKSSKNKERIHVKIQRPKVEIIEILYFEYPFLLITL